MFKNTAGNPHAIPSIISLENQERYHRAGSFWSQSLAFAAAVIGAIRVTIAVGVQVINKKYFRQ